MFEPKWPGLCAAIVGGLGVGAMIHGDAISAVVCLSVVAIDCFRYVPRNKEKQ